jgi:hypothetical protein
MATMDQMANSEPSDYVEVQFKGDTESMWVARGIL